MATPIHRSPGRDVWALVRAQHGVIARTQLLDLGMTPAGIPQRRLNGRLHEVHRGVYAVGRRELSRDGELMAAVLACGPRVDFFWPDLGFVVEADSLRHHRTAAEQTVDLSRDQAHARRGLRTLRFTHSQVFHRPAHVKVVLIDAFGHR